MKAVILAAGEGKRMRPLTHSRPKVMLPIAGRPILEHLLIQARQAQVRDFIFIFGYHDEQVRNYFGDGDKWGVSIEYRTQRRQSGTADALKMAEGLVDGDFLVINGDIIVSQEDIERMTWSRGGVLGVVTVEDTRDLGVVEVKGNRVVRIHEKATRPVSHLVNAGLYLFTPDIFSALSRTVKSPRGEYELTASLELMMAAGYHLTCQEIGYWLNLSYPWDLLSANESLLGETKAQNQGELEENVVIRGEVCLGKGTRVRSGSYIVGPVIIGDDCDIGPNCYIRAYTVIEDNCHIGSSVEVKNSIIMRGSKIPHHNYVGDSVLGENCNLGAGTKIANLRLDGGDIEIAGVSTGRRKLGAIIGDGVETGINATINVGSLISANARIGPGAVVSGVILPDSRIF
jgi:UDP-N-acetylglucosamine diphosphorylase/glucosamine-1-phosphate N-acetyltransferase